MQTDGVRAKLWKLPDVEGQTAVAGTPQAWIHNNFFMWVQLINPFFLVSFVISWICLRLLPSQPHFPFSTHASVNGYIVLDANYDMQQIVICSMEFLWKALRICCKYRCQLFKSWWGLLSTLVVILPSDISLCERQHKCPPAAATAKSNHAH